MAEIWASQLQGPDEAAFKAENRRAGGRGVDASLVTGKIV
jgi:hypothetical protein